MKTRIIGAILGLAVFIPFMLLGGIYFALMMLIVGLVCIKEFVEIQGLDYKSYVGLISSIGLIAILIPSYYLPSFFSSNMMINIFLLSMVFLMTMTVFDYDNFNIENAAVMILAMLYVGLGFNNLIKIRDIGIVELMFLFSIVWSTDIGAYVVGRAIGKTKLAPHISPNKTIEGTFGGTAIALIISVMYIYILQPDVYINITNWFLIITISIVGQFGDLVESAIKRHYNVKDSGQFIPGHGGALDRFDSTLFASLILFLWENITR